MCQFTVSPQSTYSHCHWTQIERRLKTKPLLLQSIKLTGVCGRVSRVHFLLAVRFFVINHKAESLPADTFLPLHASSYVICLVAKRGKCWRRVSPFLVAKRQWVSVTAHYRLLITSNWGCQTSRKPNEILFFLQFAFRLHFHSVNLSWLYSSVIFLFSMPIAYVYVLHKTVNTSQCDENELMH